MIGSVDHAEVNAQVNDDAGWSGRYLFMVAMSAAIAMMGMLLPSPAVVIGAMLISPLMGPIMGLGFALATLDARHIRRAFFALLAGSVLAVLFTAALVLLSPLQNVTDEITSRTRPNLFDLLVALFSALAGTYATIRGRSGTIVGVALATALMPPLATVGFGLATGNAAAFSGALLLFVTNFVTIALTATVMARLYGFGPKLSPRQTALQTLAIVLTFAALSAPLALSLRRLAWEGGASASARRAIEGSFGDGARISRIDLDYGAQPLAVTATVLTPKYVRGAEGRAAAALRQTLGRPVAVTIDQLHVGEGTADAAAVQSAQASPSGRDAASDTLADRLALVAGVEANAVFVDREAKRARVAAAVLPGASLAAYHLLEMRVAQAAPGWRVELVPPAVAPPAVTFDGDAPDAAGRAALGELAWAAQRTGLAVTVAGPRARAESVTALLAGAGVSATAAPGGGSVQPRWAVPTPAGGAIPAEPL